jgi:hypothetical protein
VATTPNGHYKLTVYLRGDQYLLLHSVALKAALDRGGGRPDASAIIRELIDHHEPDMRKALGGKRKK